MTFASLNTPAIANSGATLVTASAASLGGMVTSLASGGHPSTVALVSAFVGIAVGLFMAYCGRPSIIKDVPVSVATGGDTIPPFPQAAKPQE